MIRYYAYYNCGGFKDLYLGTAHEEKAACFYMPLLSVYKQRLSERPNDEALRSRVEYMTSLPQIQDVDSDSIYRYPEGIAEAISHGGYKLIYKELRNGDRLLLVRDIVGPKDEYGRNTPFHLLFLSDASSGEELDSIASYLKIHWMEFDRFAATLFEEDVVISGLKFNFGDFDTRIIEIISSALSTQEDKMSIHRFVAGKPIRLLMLYKSENLSQVIQELKISAEDIGMICLYNGQPIHSILPSPENRPTEDPVDELLSELQERWNKLKRFFEN